MLERMWRKGTLLHCCMHACCHFSRVWLCDPMDCSSSGSSVHGILQEYWSGLLGPPPCTVGGNVNWYSYYGEQYGLPWWLSGKESACQCRRCRFNPWVRKIPWRRKWQPIPGSLPGKSHGQRSLTGYSPWGCKRLRHDLVTKQQQRRLVKKTRNKTTYDPAVPVLGVYPEKTTIQKDTCTPMFTEALFRIARTWKQPRCPSQINGQRRRGTYIPYIIQP